MSLTFYTVITAILLLILGTINLSKSTIIKKIVLNFPRSNKAAVIMISIGLFWFLYQHVNNLGEADFGDYKFIIGLIACFIAIGSYFFINDFLSVRAICILLLFFSREVLDAAFLQEPQSRLFLVSVIYLIIIASLYFGAWPFRMRDFLSWLYSNKKRPQFFGYSFLIYAILLLAVAFTY